ncbi:inorganic triphosphatase [Ferrimonas senticii]|uniref:CYTH domain-containing protein n=1 Tax=Ferrimonas senticii TaxID=394566 RepID=UPI00040D07CA|nr:CYTH domain-containing protein [Ferrimonas senticii]
MEIEIKLLLPSHEAAHTLTQWQWPNPLTEVSRQLLTNRYFDTAEQDLRKRDMGLRIRQRNGQRELTLKTAGREIGGLHARPEYNIACDSDQPDLRLFPAGIFHEAELAELNSKLITSFSTDFERQQANLSVAGVSLELALDYGWVIAADKRQAIAELELELIDGEAKALLPLVEQLMLQQPLRLGLDSKAARGYRLAGLQPPAAVQQQWDATPEGVLAAWQRNEERLLAGELSALEPLLQLLGEAQAWQEVAASQWLSAAAQALTDAPQTLPRLIAQRQYGLCQLALLRAYLAMQAA